MIKNTSNNQLFLKYGCVWKLDTHIPHLYCPFRKKSRGQFRIQFVLIYHHLPMCFFCGEKHLFQRTSGISNGIPKRTACRCPAPQPLLTVVMPTSWLDPRSGLSCEGLKPPMNLGGFHKYSMGIEYYWDRNCIEMQNYIWLWLMLSENCDLPPFFCASYAGNEARATQPSLWPSLGSSFGKIGAANWKNSCNEDRYFLVGGFNHLEKYESQWEGLSHILWKL